MSAIIAARFETDAQAKQAIGELAEAGFDDADIAYFYVTAPGRHDMTELGGDAHHDEGTREAPRGALLGAAAGAAVGAVAALATPLAPAVGAAAIIGSIGAGAYVGSLSGALNRSEQGHPERATPEEPVSRKAGEMVAVLVDAEGSAGRAQRIFLDCDAEEIEEAEGVIENGNWLDFDPRLPPRLLFARPVMPAPRSSNPPVHP